MSTLAITKTPNHPASQKPVDAHGLTIDEAIPHLVGHTIDEVERELILHTLIHCRGSRTRSANILGISIRCMRNKIHEYEDLGIAVRAPGEPRVGRTSSSRIAVRSPRC
jgi:DNA-binding NtrC family response regulator